MRIIPKQGVCDPHIRVYNGKVYMFTTHDRGPDNDGFIMEDWRIFSSDDLLNWKLEYTLRPEDTFLGPVTDCYATDTAERNGKYYLYFSKGQECTGVAVSENGPAGPYRDALGKPLLPKGLVDTPSYDPAIFIDDDEGHTPYILFGYTVGGKQYYIARLNEDMISLAEEPRPIEIINSWDGNDAPNLNKWNGKYYLGSHRAFFAVSDNVYGSYVYRGSFCNEAYVDHGNFFTLHNQTYFAYGIPENWGEDRMNRYYRTTKMLYAHFKDNGDIAIDEFIQKAGVAHYEASWPSIKGEWYFAASDGIVKKENLTGFELRGIRDGSYLYFPKVGGMTPNALMFIRLACKGACEIEIRAGSPFGRMLGHLKVDRVGNYSFGGFDDIPVRLENDYGSNDLCFVFHGEGEDILRFEEFYFEQIRD